MTQTQASFTVCLMVDFSNRMNILFQNKIRELEDKLHEERHHRRLIEEKTIEVWGKIKGVISQKTKKTKKTGNIILYKLK